MEQVKRKTAELLNALTKEDARHCFDQWKKRMERCVARGGEYTEAEHAIVTEFLKQNSFSYAVSL